MGSCAAQIKTATRGGFAIESESMLFRTYVCQVCGWLYNEETGSPEDDLAPGTRWEDIPPNWTCPECGSRKEDFEMVEV